MAIFDEFQAEVARWRDARDEYTRKSSMFIIDFANSFREYIGSPEQYMDRLIGRALSHVQPVKATADENGNYSFHVANTVGEWLAKDETGYWVTGLQLAIIDPPNTSRMIYFWYLVRFVIRENICEMFIGFKDQKFSFALDDAEKQKAAFDFMASLVHDTLTLPPWETSKKAPIGFVPPGST